MTDNTSRSMEGAVVIARSPREVFAYVADPVRLPEWQPDVVRAAFADPSAAVGIGAQGSEVRHLMGSDRAIRWEVTEYSPGQRFALRGIDGPVRAHVTMELGPDRGGAGTRLKYAIELRGHGIGLLLAIFARNALRKEIPAMLDRVKQRLESAAGPTE